MRLDSADASATFCLTRGGRLASLVISGHEVLMTASDDGDFGWGSFPMVPYAGRVVHGRFPFGDVLHHLPRTKPPHAIHGTVWNRPWDVVERDGAGATFETDLGPDWPFGGRARQRAVLTDDRLELALTVTADTREMPAMVGWHPWFRRRLLRHPDTPAEFEFSPGRMIERSEAMIPTGRLVEPSPGPWDDCFTDVAQPLVLRWPGLVELTLSSTCSHWVVFDRRSYALCVEPQSGPPDEFNQSPRVLAPGESLTETFTISWNRPHDER